MEVVGRDYKNSKKILIKAAILQPILVSCFDGTTIPHLISTISSMMPIRNELVKEYLFYMIECNLITYSGRLRSFFIAKDGINLLLQIESMKSREKLRMEQIFLQIS